MKGILKGILATTGLALGLTLLATGSAAAAPQVLGVMAGTVPLRCDATSCRAEVSTFCLQQHRSMPEPGAIYRSARIGDITLLVTKSSGETLRLPVEGNLDFRSARGYTAVSMTLPRTAMDALGAKQVAVAFGPDASLLPAPEPGDPTPQTQEDIALSTGAMRRAASAFFEGADPRANAVRLASAIVNALPEEGRTALDRDGDAAGILLRQAMIEVPAAAADADSVALASDIHAQCARSVTAGFKFSLRRCFEAAHDRLAWALNLDFWKATAGY